ncbi:MAG: short-chain dehydrogenase [Deltaproteobacteria bacterium]|nr:MAG: short-chain dehydrogenase [Deltaproteobacteria bacterium]
MSAREVALITGASMGIGKELAKIFAADGHDLVLVARSEDKLRSLGGELESAHGITAHVVAADLTDPAAPAHIFSELEHKDLQLDYLVNNAGFGTTGPFAAGSLVPQMDMIQVNVDALVALTHLALQGMLAREKGRVLNNESTAGLRSGPDMAIYYATKAFVLMFSEGIAEEVRAAGVTVTAHCPGATATNFADTAGNAKSLLFKLGAAPADKVARHAYRSMMQGKVVAIEGLMNWLSAFSVRFGPRAFVRKVTRWLNQTS